MKLKAGGILKKHKDKGSAKVDKKKQHQNKKEKAQSKENSTRDETRDNVEAYGDEDNEGGFITMSLKNASANRTQNYIENETPPETTAQMMIDSIARTYYRSDITQSEGKIVYILSSDSCESTSNIDGIRTDAIGATSAVENPSNATSKESPAGMNECEAMAAAVAYKNKVKESSGEGRNKDTKETVEEFSTDEGEDKYAPVESTQTASSPSSNQNEALPEDIIEKLVMNIGGQDLTADTKTERMELQEEKEKNSIEREQDNKFQKTENYEQKAATNKETQSFLSPFSGSFYDIASTVSDSFSTLLDETMRNIYGSKSASKE